LFIYRWEFIRFGLDLQSSHIVVNQYGVNYIDLLGTGYGGNVGFTFLIGKRAKFDLDVVTASTSQVKESIQAEG